MAFFDKISKTVTEASQKTIAKTKDFADTTRLNATISEQEKVIKNLYLEIGKLYVSLHRDDFEEDFSGMMATIFEAEAKIDDCKKQIQDIKGVQRCPNCGADVNKDAAFCSACGTGMSKPQPVEEETVKCEKCGASVKKDMRFCTTCGNSMVAAPVEEPAPVPEISNERRCYNCDAIVPDDAAFCTECGTLLSPDPADVPVEAGDAKVCPNCNAQVPDDAAFCIECGTKL